MRIAKQQTWDRALLAWAVGADRRKRVRAALVGLLVVGLGVGLLPGVARAEYGPPGLNDAQIEVSPDGYEGDFHAFYGSIASVDGKGFNPLDVAQIFQCPENASDLHTDCLAVGAAPTDAEGNFGPTTVELNQHFPTAANPAYGAGGGVACRGSRSVTASPCLVIAATYGPTTLQPTAKAEHYICFGPSPGSACKPKPTGGWTTTTTNPPLGPEWEVSAPMNVARQDLATAVAADGRIYAMGGHEADGDPINSAETFNPCSEASWSLLPPMPTARTNLAAAAGPDGRIYAIGGRERRGGIHLATVEAYDPGTKTWSSVASLAVPRSNIAAATGSDGRIYAIGGSVGGTPGSSVQVPAAVAPIVEAYDTATNQWQVVTPLTAPRARHGATTGLDGRIYAIGGTVSNPDGLLAAKPEVQSYAPGPGGTPGAWTPAMSTPNFLLPPDMAVTTGPDGRIYGTGGVITSNTVAIRTMIIYDPATDTWTTSTESQAMTSRRTTHGAATGKDGRIYAIGGTDDPFTLDDPIVTDGPQPLSSVESLKVGDSSCPALPPVADFDGNATTDYSVFRPSTGTWFVKDGLTLNYGTEGDIPVPGDYDGDRKADVAVFRPSSGVWFVRQSSGGDTALGYGTDGDIPVPADYDGDGKTDMAVFRPSNGVWFIKYSAGGDAAVAWGTAGDVAVPADYDGDDKADLGVFRNGTWFIRPASGAADITVNYGTAGDIPVPGDYDADTTADIAVFRPSSGFWFLRHSSDGAQEAFHFGTSGDVPVPGDYNGDAIADPAVFRPSTGVWFVETGVSAPWGTATDIPLPLPHAVRSAYFGP